jgi:hypothetical protein
MPADMNHIFWICLKGSRQWASHPNPYQTAIGQYMQITVNTKALDPKGPHQYYTSADVAVYIEHIKASMNDTHSPFLILIDGFKGLSVCK